MKEKVLFSWSSGKDSALALYRLLQDPAYEVVGLLCSINASYQRVSMHGVRLELLEAQAEAIGLPLYKMFLPENPSMADYERIMAETLAPWIAMGLKRVAFGDIFLEDLRRYREEKLRAVGMLGLFPLWQLSSAALLKEFIDTGFRSVVTCVNERYLTADFAGRLIDRDFIAALPPGVDPCGENGEYHSFVFDGPLFRHPVAWQCGELVYRSYPVPAGAEELAQQRETCGFWYADLMPLKGRETTG